MACIVENIAINGDTKGKLSAAITKSLSEHNVADTVKASAILTAIFNNDFGKIATVINEKLAMNNVSYRIHSVDECLAYLAKRNSGFGINDLRAAIYDCLQQVMPSVSNYSAVLSRANLKGFKTDRAKTIAFNYLATLFEVAYYKNLRAKKEEKKNLKELEAEVRKTIYRGFYFENGVIDNLLKEFEKDDYLKTLGLIDKKDIIIKEIENIRNYASKYVQLTKEYSKEKNPDIIKELRNKLVIAKYNHSIAIDNFIKQYGKDNNKLVNYYALVQNVTKDFTDILFSNPRLHSIRQNYMDYLNNDEREEIMFSNDDDYRNFVADSKDEMSKSWLNNVATDANSYIPGNIKIYLDTIFNMSGIINFNDPGLYDKNDVNKENPLYEIYYDLDNEVGVPIAIGYNEVRDALIAMGDFSSIEAFINSIETKCQNYKEAYGFMRIVGDMRKNDVFARELFVAISRPIVDKTEIILNSDGQVSYIRSNNGCNQIGWLIYNMINQLKLTAINGYDVELTEKLNNIYNKLQSNKGYSIEDLKQQASEVFISIIKNYFPNINSRAVLNYLYSKVGEDDKTKLKNIAFALSIINTQVQLKVEEYNKIKSRNIRKYVDNRRMQEQMGAELISTTINYENFEVIKEEDDLLNKGIIELAKCLEYFTIAKININSRNAEGNQSSDQVNNCFITRVQQMLDDEEAAIKLGNDIANKKQNDYSVAFFGVKDDNGRVLVPGIFIKTDDGKIRLNVEGDNVYTKDKFRARLFNGGRDDSFENSMMYNKMSRADYFRTQLEIFDKTLVDFNSPNISRTSCFEMFFQTPSDAPKNFIIKMPRQRYDDLFKVNAESKRLYLQNVRQIIENKIGVENKVDNILLDKSEIDLGEITDSTTKGLSLKKNVITLDESTVYGLLLGNEQLSTNYSFNIKFLPKTEEEQITVPLVYRPNNKDITLIYVKGNRLDKDSNKLTDISIEGVITYNNEGKVTNDINGRPLNIFVNSFIDKNNKQIIENGTISGQIQYDVNTKATMYYAFRQQIIGELNNFVRNLNNIFVQKEVNGVRKYVLKSSDDIINLHDKYHCNIKSKKNGDKYGEFIDKNGHLTGGAFHFNRLFKCNGYNVDTELQKAQLGIASLYGELGIIKNGSINMDLVATNDNPIDSFIRLNNEGKFEFVLTDSVKKGLEPIVSKWIGEFRKECISSSNEYTNVTNSIGIETICETMFNNVLGYYNIAELYSGDVKFYGDAQNYLKRFKETQAGGANFALMDIKDGLCDTIKYEDKDIIVGTNRKLKIANQTVKYRNGFRAVTINNVNNIITNADAIYKEVYNNLKNKGYNDEQSKRIAKKIASGYGYTEGEERAAITKKNDAQSYITFEEFCIRRIADGTIEEYRDIIDTILDIREGKIKLEDVDFDDIQGRIQVQKNFYYDQRYYKDTDTIGCRQVKNAEYVLIPEFLEGTQLLEIYNLMNERDIQQLNTEETVKAAKRNVLMLWDNNGNFNIDKFKKQLDETPAAVENYFYAFLYKQQDVPSHLVDKQNKAGIQVLKKMIDNCTENTRPYVEAFMNAYCVNVKTSFNKMIFNCGWKITENDELVNIDGSPLTFENFYRKAKNEAERLGMDSNFIDYFVPNDAYGELMPNWMNNVSAKLESIAQSIFNNAITRQKLPGFHVAQVSGIGHGKKVKTSTGKYKELEYHPEVKDENGDIVTKAYAEVLVPRWSKFIPKDITEEQLESEGFNIMLGYRIPTEGKQSVSVMKVVGFLPDANDSTMMVPDAWVAQTGSDFDVDSIYTITYQLDKNGKKIKFIEDIVLENKDEERQRNLARRKIRYRNYIDEYFNEAVNDSYFTDEEKAEINLLRDKTNYKAKSEYAKTIFKGAERIKDDVLKSNIIRQFAGISKTFRHEIAKKNEDGTNVFVLDYDNIFTAEKNYLNNLYLRLDDETHAEDKKTVGMMLTIINDIFEKTEELNENYFNAIEHLAINKGLLSFKGFGELSIVEQQTTAARNNFILDNFISIMEHPDSREENYSRSNYDDLTEDKEYVDSLRTSSGVKSKKDYSAYNPFDQINYFEDAMSGAKLKAFSVTRDTFVSVCNYTKAKLSNENKVVIEYDLTKGSYNVDSIIKSFGEENVIVKGDKLYVKHVMYGHSLDNRNILGQLLTCYTSQTTAHILDAIKVGSIYNENEFTFGTFKTLIDLGTDYKTAIALLAQPGVDRIVTEYYNSKSIYVNSSVNPINETIKNICKELQVKVDGKYIDDYTSIDDIFAALNANKDIIKALNKYTVNRIDDKNKVENASYIISLSNFENNIKGTQENTFDKLIGELYSVLAFRQIYNLSQNIESLTRVSNPDKFGAKQTIKETYEVYENIEDYRETSANDKAKNIGSTLKIDGKYFVDAIYPQDENGSILVNESKYNYLAAFYKYATKTSIKANMQLFDVDRLLLSNNTGIPSRVLFKRLYGRTLNNKEFKDLKETLVSAVYNQSLFITSPITVTDKNFIVIKEKQQDEIWNSEIERINGRRLEKHAKFTVADRNNITKEEIDRFTKLTPAEKVIFIQTEYEDLNTICNKLTTNVYASKEQYANGSNKEIIGFDDQVESIEEMFDLFRNLFVTKNPLFKLTAIDLIKYAFVVEGFKFKSKNISRIITNDSLYRPIESFGTGILKELSLDNIDFISLYEKFIRANPTIATEINLTQFGEKGSKGKLASYIINKGINIMRIKKGDKLSKLIINKFNESKDADVYDIPDYIRIRFNKTYHQFPDTMSRQDIENIPPEYIRQYERTKSYTELCKVVKLDNEDIILIPLPLLDKNEVNDISVNNSNNIFKIAQNENTTGDRVYHINPKFINGLVEEIKYHINDNDASIANAVKNVVSDQYRIPKKKHTVKITYNEINKIIEYLNSNNGAYSGMANRIIDKIGDKTEGVFLFGDGSFLTSLLKNSEDNIFNIPVGEEIKQFRITKYNKSKLFKKYLNQYNTITKENLDNEGNKLTEGEKEALLDFKRNIINNPSFYKFEEVIIEEGTEEEDEYKSATTELEVKMNEQGIDNNDAISRVRVETIEADESIKILSLALDKLNKQYRLGNEAAEHLSRYIASHNINISDIQSLRENQEILYDLLAQYYVFKANNILERLNGFKTIDENRTFEDINSDEFFTYLAEHPENFTKFTQLLFEAKKLGKNIRQIMAITKSSNVAVQNNIDRINSAIDSVIKNPILVKAFENLFDIYIARNYSTNPLIRRNLISLRIAFGDINRFDEWISDVGELSNKQIQAVSKYIYGILNEATRVITPKVQKEFIDKYDEYAKDCDFNKIIDDTTGKFKEEYNENFVQDLEKHNKKVAEAKQTKDSALGDFSTGKLTETEYNNAAIAYYKALLDKRDWMARNMEQELVKEYYIKSNDNLRNVLEKAPELFVKYMRIKDEISKYKVDENLLSEEEKETVYNLRHELSQLITGFDNIELSFNEENNKFKYTYNTENAEKANILKEYIKTHSEIESEYFEDTELLEWKHTLDNYLNYIAEFDKNHTLEPLEEKFTDNKYKEAYDWINLNAYRQLNEEGRTYIEELRKKAYRLDSKKKDISDYIEIQGLINEIYKKDNAYTNGRKDATKLSKESIKYIKKIYEEHYRLKGDQFGNKSDTNIYGNYASVIKDTPKMPIFKERFYQDMSVEVDNEDTKKYHKTRNELITRINELLIKGVDYETGHISTVKLWNSLTKEELVELSNKFIKLNELVRPKRIIDKKVKGHLSLTTVDSNFINELAESKNLSKEDFKLWKTIFCGQDEDGNYTVEKANPEIYGYIIPRNLYDKKTGKLKLDTKYEFYVDVEATEARDELEKCITKVPTIDYYKAMELARREGRIDEWMEDNHYYDKTTHKFVPLPIWTKEEVIPTESFSEEMARYEYLPTFVNKTRFAKKEAKNKNYSPYSSNFSATADSKYKTIELTENERRMKNLLQEYTERYAVNESAKRFYKQGYLPREYNYNATPQWFGKQVLGLFGLDFNYASKDTWSEMDYNEFVLPNQNMYETIKTKGTKKLIPLPKRYAFATEESFKEEYDRVKAENDKIIKDNLELESVIRSRDYKEIFKSLIRNGEDYNARLRIKNIGFLLLEDLKENPAYKVNSFGRLKKNGNITVNDNDMYATEAQRRSADIIENWLHRIIFQEFKQPHRLNKAARILQNIASAKYMMLNLTGGVANVETGLANIYNELCAKDYISAKSFYSAVRDWSRNSIGFINHWITNSAPTTKEEALIKFFNVVDYDNILGKESTGNAEELIRKTNQFLYSMQSNGEHFMQNSLLLGVLKEYRVYTNSFGKLEVGSFRHYSWDIERKAMIATLMQLQEESNEEGLDYTLTYERFIKDETRDVEKLLDYDRFNKDFNREFLKNKFGENWKTVADKYVKNRETLMKEAKIEFEKNGTLESQFEFDNEKGLILANTSKFIKDGSYNAEDKTYETISNYGELMGQITQTAISINNKIHGVYNKIGAAKLESLWIGSLIMQYHKHLYPGIMKRYRGLFGNSYYNEIRGSVEKGSYVQLVQFLGTEFKDLHDRVREFKKNNPNYSREELEAVINVKVVFNTLIDTFRNATTNWNMLTEYERANIKRIWGDLIGMLKAFAAAMLIYGLTDDDDIKENWLLATALYICDRDYAEAQMYFPWGLAVEGKTLWSSPIAASNGAQDLMKIINLTYNMISDEDFDYIYTTGQYKGRSKIEVALTRNIPIYRVYNRLMNMPANNKYYRLGNVGATKHAKNLTEAIE